MVSKKVFIFAAFALVCLGVSAREVAAAPKPVDSCRTLYKSGSYVLTDNLGVAGNCIIVAADDVTLDLNGNHKATALASASGTQWARATSRRNARNELRVRHRVTQSDVTVGGYVPSITPILDLRWGEFACQDTLPLETYTGHLRLLWQPPHRQRGNNNWYGSIACLHLIATRDKQRHAYVLV